MSRHDRQLLRHLVTAVAVKLAVLAALWWVFIHDHAVVVDIDKTASHIAGTSQPSGVRP
jgi:hypothetical protein